MKWHVATVALLAIPVGPAGNVVAASGITEPAARSHCGNHERIVYSCRFGRKTASLCLGSKSIVYRYGRLGRPEIELASAPDWSNVHIGMLYSQALSENHVRITRGPISYTVRFGEAGQLSDIPGTIISGISVVRGSDTDHPIASHECKGAARIDSAAFLDIPRSAPSGWGGEEQPGGSFDGYY